MSWNNNKLSFSHLSWLRECHRAFNLSMSSEPQRLNKIIKLGADFGNRNEDFWDIVFRDNWFSMERSSVEEHLVNYLYNLPPEDALKIRDGFWGCFDQLLEIIGTDYEVEFQKVLELDTPPFTSYGKLDYFVRVNGVPLIIDAKGSSARDKKHAAQILHYSYMYWKLTGEEPKGYVFYARKGWVDHKTFPVDLLGRYEKVLEKEIETISRLMEAGSYQATVNKSCFVCGYAYNCYAKKVYEEAKFNELNPLNEDELLM